MALLGGLLPERYVEPWRPSYVLQEIWWAQITADQHADCTNVIPDTLMSESRFREICDQPSLARRVRVPRWL